jgi:pheromone receptor transcription factor
LTGTQVLLLVASETGHVYTFATPKLQPLITKPEGKNLIQACLNAPDGTDGGEEDEVKKMDKKGQKMESGKGPYPTPTIPSHPVDPLQYATASGPFPVQMYPFSGMPGVPPVQSYIQPGRFGQDYPGLPPNALWSSGPMSKPQLTSGPQLPPPFGAPGGPMHLHPSHPHHSLFPSYAQPK